MSIYNNTTELENILAAVNALPNAGSGGATENLDAVLAEQDEWIADIMTALEGKAGGSGVGGLSKYTKIIAKPETATSFVINNPLGGIAKKVFARRTTSSESEDAKIQTYIADRDYGLGVVEVISTTGITRYPVTAADANPGNSQFAITDGVIKLQRYNSARGWDVDSDYEVEIYE